MQLVLAHFSARFNAHLIMYTLYTHNKTDVKIEQSS